jgi:hypothetical protein
MMHPNAIVVTPDNAAQLRDEAERMEYHYGQGYIDALRDQVRRQMMYGTAARIREQEIRS